jgi:hypothetical protein
MACYAMPCLLTCHVHAACATTITPLLQVQYDPREAQVSLLRREVELLRQENAYLKEALMQSGAAAAGGGGGGSAGMGMQGEFFWCMPEGRFTLFPNDFFNVRQVLRHSQPHVHNTAMPLPKYHLDMHDRHPTLLALIQ